MKVKVCGITNLEDALLCQQLGADFLGFVFYEKSSRYIPPDTAKTIINQLKPGTYKVGVFVNAVPEFINKLASYMQLDFAQLHGDEPAREIEKIHIPVIKSFRVKRNFNFNVLEQYRPAQVLLDTYTENHFGGTGIPFDRSIIPIEIRPSILLAGGVSSENIKNIYYEINPFAVDLSSSLEKKPGKKDSYKVKKFFKILHELQNKQGMK